MSRAGMVTVAAVGLYASGSSFVGGPARATPRQATQQSLGRAEVLGSSRSAGQGEGQMSGFENEIAG